MLAHSVPCAGQCLNFNCMMVLVLMLRHCITFLRTRGFSQFLPLDQHIYFHKVTGVLIFIYSSVHTVAHLLNFSKFARFCCPVCPVCPVCLCCVLLRMRNKRTESRSGSLWRY